MDESIQRNLEQQNEVADVLRRAKALIAEPCRWKQYGGQVEMPKDRDAFCMMSALLHVTGYTAQMFEHARDLLAQAIGIHHVVPYEWQDAPERTHAEVLAAFDAAISLAEQSH
jgi:hypothetical protein